MRKQKHVLRVFALSLFSLTALFVGCSKDDSGSLPQVSSEEVSEVKDVSVSFSGKVISNGGSKIVAMGVCYSKENQTPQVTDSYVAAGTYTTNGIVQEEWDYTTVIDKLSPLTRYYARAYAANENGVAYGEVKEFTTKAGKTFHTLTPSMIETYTQEPSEGAKEGLIDDDFTTYWHSAWSEGVAPLPHYIQITFSEAKGIGGIQYWTRATSARSGDPDYFDLQTSTDGVNFTTVWTSANHLPTAPRPAVNTLSLDRNYYSKYFRIRILGTRSDPDQTFTFMSELKVYHDGLLD
jgi:hypothetical protein